MSAPQPDRPQMPDSFGLRDPQYEFKPLRWADVTRRVAEAPNYWVATVRPSGRPHSVPVWGVWAEDAFCFLTDRKSLTAKNLAHNPASEVHLENGEDVVMLFGDFEPADLNQAVLDAFHRKYDMPPVATEFAAYRLHHHKAIAWGSADFPSNATRWRF